MPTLDDWLNSWQSLGVRDTDRLQPIHAKLVSRYNEKHRHYHTLYHLDECFEHWASLRSKAMHPDEVELALWFHDAIYDTRREDNEERSASWAHDAARSVSVPTEVSQRIYDLVMCTRHCVEPAGVDAQALVDVDLAILGTDPDRFAEYESQIRREYSWVPDTDFNNGRIAIFSAFLKRDYIYCTSVFRGRYENQARENISRSLKTLSL